MKLVFSVTNNIVEYESFIAGLKMIIPISVSKIRVYSDCRIVNQVLGKYQTEDPRLALYSILVK